MLPDFVRRGVSIAIVAPLIDGEIPPHSAPIHRADAVVWPLTGGGSVELCIDSADPVALTVSLEGYHRPVDSLGLRLCATGVRRYLRNGYQSWDGSWFVAPGTPAGAGPPAKAPTLGFAMTALLPVEGQGAVMLGFDRHDRFQTRFRFGGDASALTIDAETLIDQTNTEVAETLFLFDDAEVEEGLRHWSRRVAAASPLPPRLRADRVAGWCSWYNHYAAIDAEIITAEIASVAHFVTAFATPPLIFQIDDGFTPEMGDWLDVKPQFPRGIAPLLADASAAGLIPGLWIAPFLVGNRSKLFAAHPEWLVQDRISGGALVAFHFYGEFRWHKRSEEYHVLDVTHPGAAAYITEVLRVWTRDWGARYIKADFLLHGAEYGPERARWHEHGVSRIAIWRRMMTVIREAVGDDVVLNGCGAPLWAGVGLVDTIRIGRDVGVTWAGEYSAESLLRDLQTRNHANGILWQADPDCLLLRDRFHEMTDDEIATLANFAAGAGGMLTTSDSFATLPPDRAAMFAALLHARVAACDFPRLGAEGPLVEQRIRDGSAVLRTSFVNPSDRPLTAPDGREVAAHATIEAQ